MLADGFVYGTHYVMLLTRNEVWIEQVPHRPKRIDCGHGTKHKDRNIRNLESQIQWAPINTIYPTVVFIG